MYSLPDQTDLAESERSAPESGINVAHLLLVVLAFGLLVLFGIAFTRVNGDIASLWLPNAFLAAVILHKDRAQAQVYVLLCGIANAVVGFFLTGRVGIPILLAVSNVIEVAIVYAGMRHVAGARPNITQFSALGWFALIGGLIAPVVSVTLATGGLMLLGPIPFWLAWFERVMAHGIGMLVAAPIMVVLYQSRLGRFRVGRSKLIEGTVILGIGSAITAIVFAQSQYPLLFVPPLFVLLSALRLGMAGAAVSIVVVTVAAVLAMYFGTGPIQLVRGNLEQQVVVLQAYLACTFAGAVPIASALSERSSLAFALSDSRNFVKTILDEMQDVVFRTDGEGRWVFLSPSWEHLTGYPVAESLGTGTRDLMPEEDKAAAGLDYVPLKTGDADNLTLLHRFRRADGAIRHVEVAIEAQRSHNGTLSGTRGTIRDVTDAHEAQIALAKSERRFSVLANLSPAGIFRTALDGACTYVNDAWLGFAGLSRDEAMGFGWVDAIHPEDREWLSENWASAVREKGRFQAEFRFQRPSDGMVNWVRAVATPELGDDGEVTGFIGVCIDFTDVVETRRRLEEQRRQFAYLAEHATDAIITVSLDGICRYASPALREISGYSPEEVMNKPVSIPIEAEGLRSLHEALDKLIAGDMARAVISFRTQHKDGSWRWHESNIRIVRDPVTGDPLETISLVRDITERKSLEDELRKARDAAEAATRAKSSFLANMSHDIRTPMNGVLGFADMLLDSELEPVQRQYAELIAESSRSLIQLINDILDFSKIEAGQMSIAAEPMEIRHAVAGSVRLMQAAASQKNLTLKTDFAAGTDRMILGDKLRLRQILSNLLGNAIKFTESGSVTVRVRVLEAEGGDRLQVAVIDTGIGITKTRLDAIFSEFQQADESTTRKYGGTGLGLAICRRLADLMHGSLAVESEIGLGSTFTLTIPITDAAPSVEEQTFTRARHPLEDEQPGKKRRILVAEDHEINRVLVSAMLDRLGYAHDNAEDGNAAVRMVRQAHRAGAPYDLVLMDIQMPNFDGIAATRKIRAAGISSSALPIVALTANAFSGDIEACLEAGMQAHVAKPIQLQELTKVLDTWIGAAGQIVQPQDPAEAMAALRVRYQAFKQDALDQLSACCALLPEFDQAQLDELQTVMHKLAGSASMFGEPAIGAIASKLENAIRALAGTADGTQVAQALKAARASFAEAA